MRELTFKVSYDDVDELVKTELMENYFNCVTSGDDEMAAHFKACLFYYLNETEQMGFKG